MPESISSQSPRDWQEQDSFAKAREALHSDVQRIDEHLAGLQWGVCTNPEYFPERTPFRVAKSKGWTDDKVLRVFFTHTESQILAWWIDEIDEADEADG